MRGVSKKLPFVDSFKLDQYFSGAISNDIQFSWSKSVIWSCFGWTKSNKNKSAPRKEWNGPGINCSCLGTPLPLNIYRSFILTLLKTPLTPRPSLFWTYGRKNCKHRSVGGWGWVLSLRFRIFSFYKKSFLDFHNGPDPLKVTIVWLLSANM